MGCVCGSRATTTTFDVTTDSPVCGLVANLQESVVKNEVTKIPGQSNRQRPEVRIQRVNSCFSLLDVYTNFSGLPYYIFVWDLRWKGSRKAKLYFRTPSSCNMTDPYVCPICWRCEKWSLQVHMWLNIGDHAYLVL